MESQTSNAEDSFPAKFAPTIGNTLTNEKHSAEDAIQFSDPNSKSIANRLSTIADLGADEIRRLSSLNQADRREEINNLKQESRMYLFFIAMIAINSAWYYYTVNLIIYYDKNELLLSGTENAKLSSLIVLPFSLKPIWGCLSDSFYLFGYR